MIFAQKQFIQRWIDQTGLSILFRILLGVIALVPAQISAQDPGTAEFQYIGNLIYARPAGIAGAYTSLAQGLDAIGYNPAGISKTEAPRSISGTVRYHFLDVTSGNTTYGFPGDGGRAYAFSAAYVNYGRIQGLDENGDATHAEHIPVSFNPGFSVAGTLGEKIRLGATVRGFSEYLGDYEESQLGLGWGLDGGLLYQPNARNLGFGLAILNLGRKERSQRIGGRTGGLLPLSIKGGMYYYPLEIPKGKVAIDLELPLHDVPLISGGIEYAYSQGLTLRAGSRLDWNDGKYLFGRITADSNVEIIGGNALKLAGGFTFQADGVAVDYALQYWNGLNWVHALTLRYALI